MEIRKGMSEDSGEQCYALVSELLIRRRSVNITQQHVCGSYFLRMCLSNCIFGMQSRNRSYCCSVEDFLTLQTVLRYGR